MLPHSDGQPAMVTEFRISIPVTGNVRFDLAVPKACVSLRMRAVLGTPVPEAPINEDCDLLRSEYEVRLATEVRQRPNVQPVSQPTHVQLAAQKHLRLRVAGPLLRHPSRRCARPSFDHTQVSLIETSAGQTQVTANLARFAPNEQDH